MAARGNDLIQGMTHADLLDVIHEAIEANVNLQLRDNQRQDRDGETEDRDRWPPGHSAKPGKFNYAQEIHRRRWLFR